MMVHEEILEKEILELETEIKLHINRRLFEKGLITEELYSKAIEIILVG